MTPYQNWLLAQQAGAGLGSVLPQDTQGINLAPVEDTIPSQAPINIAPVTGVIPPRGQVPAAPAQLPWSADPPQPGRPLSPVEVPSRDYPVAQDNEPANPTSYDPKGYVQADGSPRWSIPAAVDSWLYTHGKEGRDARDAAPAPITTPADLTAPRIPFKDGMKSEDQEKWDQEHGLSPMADPKGTPTIDPSVEAKGGKALNHSGESPTPASKWDRSRNWMRPETQDELLQAGKNKLEAAQNIGQDEAIAALDRSALYKDQAERLTALEIARQKAEQDRTAKVEAVGQDVDKLSEEARNAKIDPNEAWGHADFGTKLAVILGATLGGMLQGRGVTKDNTFITQMNQMTQDSIDAQKANLNNKWRGAEAKRSLYGDMLNRYKDERSAELASKLALNEITAQKAQAMGAEADSVVVQDRAKQAVAAIQQENATLKAQIQDRAEFIVPTAATPSQATAAQASDVLLKSLYAIPDKATRERAMREYEGVRGYESKMASVLSAFDAAGENRTYTSMLPGPDLRSATQKYHASKAAVLSTTKGLGPEGLSSDKDREAFLEPLVPQPTDSDETISFKRRQLIDHLRPQTPILDGLNRNPRAIPLER